MLFHCMQRLPDAALAIVEREALIGRVQRLEPVLKSEVSALASHQLVSEVRTAGLLAGVEIQEAARTVEPSLVDLIVSEARGSGFVGAEPLRTDLANVTVVRDRGRPDLVSCKYAARRHGHHCRRA